MEYNPKFAREWLAGAVGSLPRIDEIIKNANADVLIIGAGVFDLYLGQDWVPAFKRKTGDLDLSIGLVHDTLVYENTRDALLQAGYKKKDQERQYRYYPPVEIPGALAYVDLLAHPASMKITEDMARGAMGAGPGFNFGAMNFAMLETYRIETGISFPNPLAMMALKLRAYEDDPIIRLKDLGDVAELAWGLVEKGVHFKIGPLWEKVKKDNEAINMRKALQTLGENESAKWDLESARNDLERRNFSDTDIETNIPERILELVENLPV